MKLPDVNLLLYAVDEESPSHDPAREWLEAVLSGTETIAFAWVVLLGFLRISTNLTGIEQPLQPGDALQHIDEWLAQQSPRSSSPPMHMPQPCGGCCSRLAWQAT